MKTNPSRLSRRTIKTAVSALKKQDRRMAKLIEKTGPCELEIGTYPTHFEFVVRSIVFQQLAYAAANTIHGRVVQAAGGKISPATLAALSDDTLRKCGLSTQKLSYMRDLIAHAVEDRIAFEKLHQFDDEQIIAELTKVRGIGRWTAQMFLLFQLGSPDVLSELDLGIQKGIQILLKRKELPKPKEVLEIGKTWAPYRSIASWYLWRCADSQKKNTK